MSGRRRGERVVEKSCRRVAYLIRGGGRARGQVLPSCGEHQGRCVVPPVVCNQYVGRIGESDVSAYIMQGISPAHGTWDPAIFTAFVFSSRILFYYVVVTLYLPPSNGTFVRLTAEI